MGTFADGTVVLGLPSDFSVPEKRRPRHRALLPGAGENTT